MGKSIERKTKQKTQSITVKHDDDIINKYGKLLNIRKKKRSFLSDLFAGLESESEDLSDEEMIIDNVSENSDNLVDDEEVEDIDSVYDDEEAADDNTACGSLHENSTEVSRGPQNDHDIIKRKVVHALNRLCESQMVSCLDQVENLFDEFPRGIVRNLFIDEAIAFTQMSSIDHVAFVCCLHLRLQKHMNLIAFYLEKLMEKLNGNLKKKTLCDWMSQISGYLFIAYATRLEVIDSSLIFDILFDLMGKFETLRLKAITEITSIVGHFLRKHNTNRCTEFVTAFKDKINTKCMDEGDISERKSYAIAVVEKLTSSAAKNDIQLQKIVKYKKQISLWSKKPVGESICFRLADFKSPNKVRWWLVGSAVNPHIAENVNMQSRNSRFGIIETLTEEEKQWNELAKQIGLSTEGKQRLFRVLMRGKISDTNECLRDTVMQIHQMSKSSADGVILPEPEVVSTIVRCFSLETEFCPFYVTVLIELIDMHRRFRQMVKCAIWDMLAMPKLIESVRSNCGRCVGQLICVAKMPLNILKKFNFSDTSQSNVAFLMGVLKEIFEESWSDIDELLRQIPSQLSKKFATNLRVFLKKNIKNSSISKAMEIKVEKAVTLLQSIRTDNI